MTGEVREIARGFLSSELVEDLDKSSKPVILRAKNSQGKLFFTIFVHDFN